MARPRRLAMLACVLVAACRRDVSRLDEVQKMAYGVKPAVVRISAYATAEFRYPSRAIDDAARQLGTLPRERAANESDATLATGAGGSGSGFIIHPDGWILTSGHVVAPTRDPAALENELRRNGAIAALVKHFPIDTLRTLYRDDALDATIEPLANAGSVANVKVVNQVELSNGETLPFTIRRFSPSLASKGADLALLQIARKNLPSLPLGDSESTRVGESIWSVGYPAVASSTDEVIGGWLSRDSDLEATFNPGTITAIKTNVAKTPVFQTNVAIYRGNSGGPAVNREGEVIGISTWGHTNAEAIKFLVPVDVAKSLLKESGVVANAGGEFDRHYRTALDAAGDGRWIDAKKELLVATHLYPNSPDLIRFGRDAERALRDLPPWRLHPWLTSVLALLMLAAVIVATSLVVRSRKPRIPADLLKATTIETLVAPNGVSLLTVPLGKFTILNGTRAGEKLGLGGSGIRIGRESTICEIVLENPKVSRLHAEVVSIDGKVLLIDRNSSNGTYVNDQKIDKRFLRDGDIIYFGGRNAVAVAFHA
ncbi:MAG TPA: trypsin-like peptidase domain-containing protein [Thermoanaerobaculia bacterium]|nr:trypsin-like peptidase domain-containing protein [Thermoanaerobaculia bacterium]